MFIHFDYYLVICGKYIIYTLQSNAELLQKLIVFALILCVYNCKYVVDVSIHYTHLIGTDVLFTPIGTMFAIDTLDNTHV